MRYDATPDKHCKTGSHRDADGGRGEGHMGLGCLTDGAMAMPSHGHEATVKAHPRPCSGPAA